MPKKPTRTKVEPGIWRTPAGTYEIHYRDSLGKQRVKTVDRLVDARSVKAEMRLRKQRGEVVDPSAQRTRFDQWSKQYLDQKIALRERTLDKYESALRTHLLPTFGSARMSAITRTDVQSWIVQLHAEGYAPESIRGLYAIFAAMMKLAEEEGVIAKTPCRRIELPALVRDEQRYLTTDEVERLANEVDSRYRLVVYVASYVGLRWQEVAGLKKQYVNVRVDPATIRVVSTIERARGRYRAVDIGKSKAARRTLKVPGFLRDMLIAHLAESPAGEWVFQSPKGGFLRYDNFRTRVWDPAINAAGLSPLTFHQLRHTAAAFMIDEGGDPLQVKRRMGHEDIRTTLNTYGHLFPDREDDLVAALDRRRSAFAVRVRSVDQVS
jgi:integrase